MGADDLATQRTTTSAGMELTYDWLDETLGELQDEEYTFWWFHQRRKIHFIVLLIGTDE